MKGFIDIGNDLLVNVDDISSVKTVTPTEDNKCVTEIKLRSGDRGWLTTVSYKTIKAKIAQSRGEK